MKKILIRFSLLILLFVVIFLLFRVTPLKEYADFSRISESRDSLLAYVDQHFTLFILLFIAAYIAVVALSIPGATVLSISGGFFFGPLLATLFINIGATLGAILVFWAARIILGNSIQEKYADKLKKLNSEIEENGYSYLLTLRLIPVFPFFLVNLLAGVTSVKALTFMWTTALGIIPGSFVYAYLGYAGASLKPGEADFPYEALIALGLLGLLSLVPVVVKKLRKKKALQKEL